MSQRSQARIKMTGVLMLLGLACAGTGCGAAPGATGPLGGPLLPMLSRGFGLFSGAGTGTTAGGLGGLGGTGGAGGSTAPVARGAPAAPPRDPGGTAGEGAAAGRGGSAASPEPYQSRSEFGAYLGERFGASEGSKPPSADSLPKAVGR